MAKLEYWDFSDKAINSKLQQINRQKSALNLKIIDLDRANKRASFHGDFGPVTATLADCTCEDFNYIGGYPRKKFFPCMHIYRLALELGIMTEIYVGEKTRRARMTDDERKADDLLKLQNIAREHHEWGAWSPKLHKAWQQTQRQGSAYEIATDEDQLIDVKAKTGTINGYQVSLSECTCADFKARRLPCKHIYCLALLLKIQLLFTHEDFLRQKQSFRDNFIPIISIKMED